MNNGIIYTNDKCIGCNKCIKVCSAIGACISVQEGDKARIDVDGNRCVACGSCMDVCEHGAREFSDDTVSFFEDLKKGEKISLLIAPAFRANYPDEYESVLGGLKSLGVDHIISVSFGADITTWGYLNYIKKYDFVGGISQPCPALVSYIERYLPKLLDKLFPVQSPLMCAAIYARKQLGIKEKFAFISPCIAKKIEIDDPHNEGLVQYNVTFEHLMKYVREHDIKGPFARSEIEYGLGSFYPTPGGLTENVKWFLGDEVYVRQIEGEKKLYDWLHQNEDKIRDNKTPFLFIDALNCEKGCICGTAVDPEKSKTDDALYALLDIREKSKKGRGGDAWSKPDTPEERLAHFNEQFKDLELSDYLRGYTDLSAGCAYDIPNEVQLDTIFNSMNKFDEKSRSINCTCCGYEGCRQMAMAIHNGFNHKENCIYYEKSMVQELEVQNVIAQEASKAKSAFLANMSHEIRTPINAVIGMNEMILRECTDDTILGYSENIKSAGNALLGLVNNILDFSKIESGKTEIISEDYDLRSLLKDVVTVAGTRMAEKDIEFILDWNEDTPRFLNGDREHIRQIITNLLSNAAKYTGAGSVTFKVDYSLCENDSEHVLLSVAVSDTGMGIKPEDMDKLFDKFERLDEKRNRNVEGTGLGLSITKKLLQLMGSDLEVESEYEKGSVFSFTVKQGMRDTVTIGDKTDDEDEPGSHSTARFVAPSARVLVVDDNPMNLVVFTELLKRTMIEVDTADGGDAGLELLKKNKYDVIFLDHMMPVKDGVETLRELKGMKDCINVSTTAVCLTANAIRGAREEYLDAGFDDYLTKPIDPEKLEQKLWNYLPKDKLIESDQEDEIESKGADGKKEDDIPGELLILNDTQIDFRSGIKRNLTTGMYMKVLRMFFESIDEKSGEIENFYRDEDYRNYTIRIHALKSSARIIGAERLGDKAQELENAGNAEDVTYIRENHGSFINDYLEIKDLLSQVFGSENENDERPLADEEMMRQAFADFMTAAEAMDSDTLETICEEMDHYRIPGEHFEKYNRIKAAVRNFDYDKIIELIG